MKISSFLSFPDTEIRTCTCIHTNFSQCTDFSQKSVRKIGTCTDYSQKSVHIRIILKNWYTYGYSQKSV